MQYKEYTLDRFQEEAIQAIEQGYSTIVTAPTGAGKTVIAEYAVDKCIELDKRIIYTAPIKALSNQKYRDFSAQYGDQIGIMTGDVVLNGNAPVLLMTTEVFRNTVFDNSERLEDVEYVIFDEIHYINDIQRGTVWEESIIFAPQNIRFICLSATIPNIAQFTQWMQTVREHPIVMVEETERPVPLHHALYIPGHGVGDCKTFRALRQAMDEEKPIEDLPGLIQTDLIRHIQESRQLPCLYFCFSRKGCELNAQTYADRNFLTPSERDQIIELYDDLCDRYRITDESRVVEFRSLIRRGVAYHHAGMLPTLKEVVERLFTSGLIKLLFTTETFAVGINMPACTVVFDSLEKYDGVGFRYLTSREYHQMSGRAGRRGIDPVGYVYARINPRLNEPEEVERVLLGEIEPIESQFNLSYSSILNLYTKYGDDIYDVCTASLSNYQNIEIIQQIDAQLAQLDAQQDTLQRPHCVHSKMDAMQEIGGYVRAIKQFVDTESSFRQQRAMIRRKFRGRKNRLLRNRKLEQLNRQRQVVYNERNGFRCHECRYQRPCGRKFEKIEAHYQHHKELQLHREHVKNYQREQIHSRLRALEDMGYIDGNHLLPRGEIASQIYGYELQVTELLFQGVFEQVSEDAINVLVISIVTETRKDEWYRKLERKDLRVMIQQARDIVAGIRRCEIKHRVSEPVPDLDTKLCAAMLAWSQGCEFEKLHDLIDLADGDLVRSIRLVIDLLRQMRRTTVDDKRLQGKLSRCIDKINRDVVDAERQLRTQ